MVDADLAEDQRLPDEDFHIVHYEIASIEGVFE
jgi:hypothetical protein